MMLRRILIAGVGNILCGDDGFGIAAAQRLQTETLPDEVCVKEFGIRGFDLAVELLHGYDVAILLDAARRGGPPGTLYVIEPVWEQANAGGAIHPHGLYLEEVFGLVEQLGGRLPQLYLVGCEPAWVPAENGCSDVLQLSPAVECAVSGSVELVRSLVAGLLQGECRR
jgi:hydrogenase maturation protease